MFHRKKEEDTEFSEEKRNQFIREQIRPQRKRQIILWIKRFVILLAAACIFGGVAGGLIVYIQNHFSKPREDKVKISTYSSSLPETSGLPEKAETQGNEMNLNKANRFTQRLAAVGSKLDASLVGVKSKSSARGWLIGEGSSQTVEYGLLVQESETAYDILTTQDVVQGQTSVIVQLMDDTTVEGTILGSDIQLNIAMICIQKSDIEEDLVSQMKVAKLGKGLEMTKGTNVIAVGCPNGVPGSVAIGRIINDMVDGSITDGEVQLYCTDIPFVENGNGVVLDTGGNVIGILTTGFIEETGTMGLSFIKLSEIMPVLELLQQKKNAPYLGIEGTSLDITRAKAHKLEVGAYVTEVYSGSPAYESGMRVADVIVKVDDNAVSGMTDIYQELLEKKTGDTVVYTVSRTTGNQQIRKKIKVKLG